MSTTSRYSPTGPGWSAPSASGSSPGGWAPCPAWWPGSGRTNRRAVGANTGAGGSIAAAAVPAPAGVGGTGAAPTSVLRGASPARELFFAQTCQALAQFLRQHWCRDKCRQQQPRFQQGRRAKQPVQQGQPRFTRSPAMQPDQELPIRRDKRCTLLRQVRVHRWKNASSWAVWAEILGWAAPLLQILPPAAGCSGVGPLPPAATRPGSVKPAHR